MTVTATLYNHSAADSARPPAHRSAPPRRKGDSLQVYFW